ncbi:tRNA dimethylallyltransferase, mitochondrial [Coemansia aciculifera]|uniref:tRNA dimethylallyltransferase, mitochondrial n=1 Tax=Coemansia aciculifera TaxID=417176 RepID=A0ACC1LUN1_9FUNG|nr:tRNA dimethylallyltransferase, mitochondrial [Coemansia aciculifera]
MIERGMFDELSQLGNDMEDQSAFSRPADGYSAGLKQAIGFREFGPYLEAIGAGSSDASDEALETLRRRGVEDMKLSTRRYAKRQIAWIRNKLLPECNSTLAKSIKARPYVLDATDLDKWDALVRVRGVEIAKQFINDEQNLPDPMNISETAAKLLAEAKEKPNSVLAWKRFLCPVCSKAPEETMDGVARQVWLNGEDEYNQHLRSQKHRKNRTLRKRLAERDSSSPGAAFLNKRLNAKDEDSD